MPSAEDEPEVLGGGNTHIGVVRIGDTVRRPRTAGAELAEAFLLHLESVGFPGAPRFLGVDDAGRQVLSFVEGTATPDPPWQPDDDANIARLADIAGMVRQLHDAGHGFVAPNVPPRRPLPAPGATWNHGDVHYGNIVFRDMTPVALLDWDFVAPADELYDVVSLLLSARAPRPDRPDEYASRAASAHRVLAAVLDAYGATDEQRHRAPQVAAALSDDTADYFLELGADAVGPSVPGSFAAAVARHRYLAAWWRVQPAV